MAQVDRQGEKTSKNMSTKVQNTPFKRLRYIFKKDPTLLLPEMVSSEYPACWSTEAEQHQSFSQLTPKYCNPPRQVDPDATPHHLN
ncbi:hypothetical protein T265_03624 [Opisthorchis viverrini]|uniref:Uncharacterized protein n=1 Tax=Opisthorchis viverrini TaxID=6198 RepID=A0A075AHG2_OPIVI|nr:hypothetical protein T265_03624 [Opisthorchis viverrini]KER29829.1 hypothetical protein T265_03624 [Opisthorchis viverrini]